MTSRNQFGVCEHPVLPERVFRAGQLVRFLPPEGSYSPKAVQRKVAGETGMVVSLCHGDYAVITFGRGEPVLCQTAYLREVVTP